MPYGSAFKDHLPTSNKIREYTVDTGKIEFGGPCRDDCVTRLNECRKKYNLNDCRSWIQVEIGGKRKSKKSKKQRKTKSKKQRKSRRR